MFFQLKEVSLWIAALGQSLDTARTVAVLSKHLSKEILNIYRWA